MSTEACQCEHVAHFADTGRLTPNGNPGHAYGAKFEENYLVTDKTTFGTFRVCKDCVEDCVEAFK